MFEEWKRAWREAVENFRRELNRGDGDVADLGSAARRELAAAAAALARVEADLERTCRERDADLEAERVCRRREALARRIDDEETARIAAEFARRHGDRAAVLEQKAAALAAERALRARELDAMRAAIDELSAEADAAGGAEPAAEAEPPPEAEAEPEPAAGPTRASVEPEHQPDQEGVGATPNQASDDVFRALDRRARERLAEAQLERLKRRMQ